MNKKEGTYSFIGEPMFYFSLVRQFPNCEEEYYQIHVDENIFAYIKKSQEFYFCKVKELKKVDIYIDET